VNKTGPLSLDADMLDAVRFAATPSVVDDVPLYDSHNTEYYVINVDLLETTMRRLVSVMTRKARVADQGQVAR
jgi:hypothetical protein